VLANLAGVLAALIGLGIVTWRQSQPKAPEVQLAQPVQVRHANLAPKVAADPVAAPPRPASPAPQLDLEKVSQAEAELAAAKRERLRAEARAEEAAAALKAASTESAARSLGARTLASRVRDPSARIARASARMLELREDKERLEKETIGLAQAPRPKRKSLVDRTPVAKVPEGREYHFEVRHNRVAFIDLDRLLEMAATDARLRMRMDDSRRSIVSSVGPVGPFSLQYELGRALPASVEELLENHRAFYAFKSWEVVPEFEGRGEPFEMAFRPASDFARTINRLRPARSTITMWVYPDGFGLYRKLRDALHARGFLVAARPLPAALPIRGSTAGSISAGQ
jgi:hypothetical protein